MPKSSSRFVCQQCGYESPKWMGRCPECGAWDSLVEEVVSPLPKRSAGRKSPLGAAQPVRLAEVSVEDVPRLSTGITELDRVLGGGIVPVLLCCWAAAQAWASPPCSRRWQTCSARACGAVCVGRGERAPD